MNLTYSAMVLWIDEAKKADYFGKHFVMLSKMIMNGTKTMARGLVTMHGRGEDLSTAPMSIGYLISLSSYHFRKSYLGVIQTAKTRPEISERLLLNQLGWCNTLMRLYKTKEKLEKGAAKAVPQSAEAQLLEDLQENPAIEETKAAGQLIEGLESTDLTNTSVKAAQGVESLPEQGSFKEAGAYKVIRAFASFDHHDSTAGKSSRALNAAAGSEKCKKGEARMSGKKSGFSEAVLSENQEETQKNRPDETKKLKQKSGLSGKKKFRRKTPGQWKHSLISRKRKFRNQFPISRRERRRVVLPVIRVQNTPDQSLIFHLKMI